jgi:hypothetical protein
VCVGVNGAGPSDQSPANCDPAPDQVVHVRVVERPIRVSSGPLVLMDVRVADKLPDDLAAALTERNRAEYNVG